jgi:hypothetical protein
MLIYDERHLSAVLERYAGHYNATGRTNPDTSDHPTTTPQSPCRPRAPVQRRKVLGGVINEYYTAA